MDQQHQKIKEFLKCGSQTRNLDDNNLRVLEGWKLSTLISYNTAVKKFIKFKLSIGQEHFILPILSTKVYKFVAWAGRGRTNNGNEKINASLVTRSTWA